MKTSHIFDEELLGSFLSNLFKDHADIVDAEVEQAKRLMDRCFVPSSYEGLCGVYAVGLTNDEESDPYIPCKIGNSEFPKVLCDFGTRASIITNEVFLGLSYEVKARLLRTELELELTRTEPLGVIKDLKIEVKKNNIPIDFFVLDSEVGAEDVILGRPFHKLVQAILDTEKGQLKLVLGGEGVLFEFNDHPQREEFLRDKDEHQYTPSYVDPQQRLFGELTEAEGQDSGKDDLDVDRHYRKTSKFEPLGDLDPDDAPEVE